ncbi:unnamed protein product, partial [marine sediment metagenome]
FYLQWQTLALVIAVFVIIGMSQAMIASLEAEYSATETRIPSALQVVTPDGEEIEINFYWDVLGQNPVTSLDYGEFAALESSSLETWVRNEALIDVWLTLNWQDLDPPDADQYITLSWDWVKLIDTWQAYSEEFSIVGNQLVFTSQFVDPLIRARVDPGFNQEILTKTKITSGTSPESQIVFRYVDSQNYYFAGIGAWGYKAGIGRIVNGVATRLAETGNPGYVDINLDQWYDLRIRVAGSTFTLYVDGEEVCVGEDTTLGYGEIGLRGRYSDVVWDSYVVLDAFDPDNILFQDFFIGAPLEVSTSRKVTFTVTSIANTPPADPPEATYDFTFDSIVTAYDDPVEIKFPEPLP